NFTITVSADEPGLAPPPGTVTVQASGVDLSGHISFTGLGGATLASGFAFLSSNSLPSGSQTVNAFYVGDINYLPTTTPSVTLNVQPAGTTTQLFSSNSGISFVGTPVTFTAQVNAVLPSHAIPTGVVDFYSDSTLLGSAQLSSNRAQLTTAALTGS